jgi:capsular exopolysaccharide synthesis family protein
MNKLKSIKSILFTNTRSYSDNTSIAADLAGLIAQSGKRVLLVDADLHQPIIHQIFNLPNRVGLSDVLSGERNASEIMHYIKESKIQVITSGKTEITPLESVHSTQMIQFLQGQKDLFDKIIIHGPPFFYAETTTMAALVDGVILMIHPGYAKSETSKAIIEKFQRSGATIIGIVMRNQPKHTLNQSAFIDRLLTYDKGMRIDS